MAVLISGKAGAGKTTLANMVLENLRLQGVQENIVVEPFAKKLKQLATELGWNGVKDEAGRRFLQNLGSAIRSYDEDYFAREVDKNTMYADLVIIDDWRFPNEARYFNNTADIMKVAVIGRQAELAPELANDPSETSLPDPLSPIGGVFYDQVINNSGNLDYLRSLAGVFSSILYVRMRGRQ